MLRRLRIEMHAVSANIKLILLGAFLCAVGGVLLWINGGSTWYFLRSASQIHAGLSLSGVFVAWLITYGLTGAMLALVWSSGRYRLCGCRVSLCSFGLISAVYLLMLVWYALFFCTRLFIFSLVILSLSVVLCAMALILLRKTMVLIWMIGIMIEAIQIYFIYFSFAMHVK